tara:strand:- start:288 stop:1199 length:912 start_codon:yes stop_codon:yes gene_type:complete
MRAPFFKNQTNLLLNILGNVLPLDSSFVLKGGTAINFIWQNLPRLSVDIDLTYKEIGSRDDFIKANDFFYRKREEDLKNRGLLTQLQRTQDKIPKQLLVSSAEASIKIETNLILRGTVYPTEVKKTCQAIKEQYDFELYVPTVSFEDLYAGKFCAALDRQHPRDLFDIKMFFEKYKITEKLKKAFIVYLISSNRPISEIISPNYLNQRDLYENEFRGMTSNEVSYEELEGARETLIKTIREFLTLEDKEFLINFKKANPNWSYLNLPHIKNMPAIKWKLHNIKNMNKEKHADAINKLEKKLFS